MTIETCPIFTSKRLEVFDANPWFLAQPQALAGATLNLLSPKVVTPLPNDWQQITTVEDALAWLQARFAEAQLLAIRLRQTDEVIGFIFIYQQDKSQLHIGYLLGEAYWGKGYASELLQALVDYYRQQGDTKKLFAGVGVDNPASIKVLEKCGFELDERSQDTLFYCLGLGW